MDTEPKTVTIQGTFILNIQYHADVMTELNEERRQAMLYDVACRVCRGAEKQDLVGMEPEDATWKVLDQPIEQGSKEHIALYNEATKLMAEFQAIERGGAGTALDDISMYKWHEVFDTDQFIADMAEHLGAMIECAEPWTQS